MKYTRYVQEVYGFQKITERSLTDKLPCCGLLQVWQREKLKMILDDEGKNEKS